MAWVAASPHAHQQMAGAHTPSAEYDLPGLPAAPAMHDCLLACFASYADCALWLSCLLRLTGVLCWWLVSLVNTPQLHHLT